MNARFRSAVLVTGLLYSVTAPAVDQSSAVSSDSGPPMVQPQQATVPPPATQGAPKNGPEPAGTAAREKSLDLLSRLKLSGYLQSQYVQEESSVDELTSSGASKNRDQFSIRRARVKFSYQATKNSKFVFEPDVTGSGASLKDAWVQYTEPHTTWKNTLTAGQFKWPFGFELAYSSSERELPERSRVVRALFPGERDRGVMISGRGFAERFTYAAALVNGSGTTQNFDSNRHKDAVARVAGDFGPFDVGLSIYRGRDLIRTATRPLGAEFDKNREGIDVQLRTPLPGLVLRGEYIQGQERGFEVSGWYFYAVQNAGKRNQFALRVDEYDPDSQRDSTPSSQATRTIGGSYIFSWDAHSKVMFAYERPELDGASDPRDNVFTLRFQYKL